MAERGDEDHETYYVVDKKRNTVAVIHWDGEVVTLLDAPKNLFESLNEGKDSYRILGYENSYQFYDSEEKGIVLKDEKSAKTHKIRRALRPRAC